MTCFIIALLGSSIPRAITNPSFKLSLIQHLVIASPRTGSQGVYAMSTSHLRPPSSGHRLYSSPNTGSPSTSSTQAGPSYESYLKPSDGMSPNPRRTKHFRPWSFSHRSTQSHQANDPSSSAGGSTSLAANIDGHGNGNGNVEDVLRSYSELRVSDNTTPSSSTPRRRDAPPPPPRRPKLTMKTYASSDEDDIPDSYSYSDWVDPSEVGTANLRRTVSIKSALGVIGLSG